jgi:radical SAM protein with 4Fe4S-binding SPASM domain
MNTDIQQLHDQLKEKYSIKAFVDLGDICVRPGALMEQLDLVYQDAFEETDRIVFYTGKDIPESLLKHLYSTTNFLDISNYFVLVCAPANNKSDVAACCEKYSSDPVPFQFLSVELNETAELVDRFSLPDTICAIPWSNLEIRSDGTITPCCMSTDISLGNIQTDSLESAFNSAAATQLRQDLSNGIKSKNCSSCWKVEDQGLTSIRLHNKKRLKKSFLLKSIERPEINTLDIKFNNICNFKCRICGSGSSSLFAYEEHKFKGIPLNSQPNWGESDKFLKQLDLHIDCLDNIDMYGGEPFLMKKFAVTLKSAVDKGVAKNIRLHYNSNGSVWPKEFLKYWPHFKLVDIHFSIDDIGQRFELERGGNWDEVEKNIISLKNLNLPNLKIQIMPTISIMNIYYIDELYNWAQKHNFPIFVSHVRGKGFELENLTYEARDLIIEKYKNHPWDEMKKIVESISDAPLGNPNRFIESTKWFDTVREENFSTSHPEIAKAMKYN